MKKDNYKNEDYKEGIFTSNEKGFGFITVEGEKEDYFVPERHTAHAWNKDLVRFLVVPSPHGAKFEAHIIEIISHAVTEVVGEFDKAGSFGFVICDDRKIPYDIHIEGERTHGARAGQKCVVKLLDHGSERKSPEGEIIEILGNPNDPGVDILALVRGANVPVDFSADAIDESESLERKLSKKDLKHRKDFRDLLTITIDGNDSKDFDDAVSLQRDGKEFVLYVHIADVSHFVKEGSFLDLEAKNRGNSIYLADRVIPMLPSVLSDDLCSLVEGSDRLTLSCVMRFSQNGKLKEKQIVQSVIRSDHRMTYDNVNLILSGDDGGKMRERYTDIAPMLDEMDELAGKLRKRMMKRGAVEFDLPESEIILDEKGHAVDVRKRSRGRAERMIEDFMLSANEAVAKELSKKKIPLVYRVHDVPDAEKAKKLIDSARKFGHRLIKTDGALTPQAVAELITSIKGRDEEAFLTELALRSMQRAEYSTENIGHFGLASEYYCHFTSPIRRYPDLLVHRMIHLLLSDSYKKKLKKSYEKTLKQAAKHSSDTERRADDLERAVDSMKKAEYMADHIGEVFDGRVSGAIRRGVFVALENTVEGMVPTFTMKDDVYDYDEDNMEIIGKNFNRHYSIGTKVKVKCTSADKLSGSIDFVFVDENGDEFKRREEKTNTRAKKGSKAELPKNMRKRKGGSHGRKNRTKTYRK